jgi:dihydrofolate reductase
MHPNITIIAAVAKNNVIGLNGKIPWHEKPECAPIKKADLSHFKRLTLSHPVIMGRKSYLSIPEQYRPLSKRTNIILSRDSSLNLEKGVIIAHSIDEAIGRAMKIDQEEIFIAGGSQVYEEGIKTHATHMRITEVTSSHHGDTHFPEFSKNEWSLIEREFNEGFNFAYYERRNPKDYTPA